MKNFLWYLNKFFVQKKSNCCIRNGERTFQPSLDFRDKKNLFSNSCNSAIPAIQFRMSVCTTRPAPSRGPTFPEVRSTVWQTRPRTLLAGRRKAHTRTSTSVGARRSILVASTISSEPRARFLPCHGLRHFG